RVTSADVRHTVDLLKRPDLPGRVSEWADLVEEPRVEGDSAHVRLTLRQGYLEPLALMTFKVLPQKPRGKPLLRADDQQFGLNPVGSGPFQYEGRVQKDDRPYARFLANPNYHRASRPGLPHVREIRFYEATNLTPDFLRKLHLIFDVPSLRVKAIG